MIRVRFPKGRYYCGDIFNIMCDEEYHTWIDECQQRAGVMSYEGEKSYVVFFTHRSGKYMGTNGVFYEIQHNAMGVVHQKKFDESKLETASKCGSFHNFEAEVVIEFDDEEQSMTFRCYPEQHTIYTHTVY
jgi:hypothetical protein